MTLSLSNIDGSSFNWEVVCMYVDDDTEECIEVQIKRTVATHRYSCICSDSNRNMIVVPQDSPILY